MGINDDRVYWVWLTKVFGVANADLWRLCEGYESVGEFARLCQLGRIEELTRQQRTRAEKFSFDDARELIDRCENSGVKVISFESPDYPKKLRRIPNPPAVIFAKGNISLLSSKPAILVVGTRHPCDYSVQAAELICNQLSQMGITVITGVEQGIDSCAIESALDCGGAAAGVCGKGIFGERHSTELCEWIAQKGVLLSEYTDSSEFGSVRYDYRNRIMCGLCDGVLFVECSEKSHGLNNVSHAKRLGKPIFALSPADISDKRFFGQRDLIRNGACPVFDAYDILDRLKQGVGYVPTETAAEAEKMYREKLSAEKSGNKISTNSLKKVKKIQKIPDKDLHKSEMSVKIDMSALNDTQKKIHAVLSENGAVHINTLAEKLELPIPKIMSELMVMQLKGITEELPGRQIKLK